MSVSLKGHLDVVVTCLHSANICPPEFPRTAKRLLDLAAELAGRRRRKASQIWRRFYGGAE